jgi:hypothetical protein
MILAIAGAVVGVAAVAAGVEESFLSFSDERWDERDDDDEEEDLLLSLSDDDRLPSLSRSLR